MTALDRPFLLDMTRLVARSWTRRLSTGIDRVSYAYLRHFGASAQAVVQHRGVLRVLTGRHSDALFEMCLDDDAGFRRRMLSFAPAALASGTSHVDGRGATYINVGHTDFDLAPHLRWTERSRLRSAYLIHDLIPITHAEYCRPHAVRRHRGRVVNALLTATGIIVNSSATGDDLADFAHDRKLPLPPVLAAPLGGASINPSSAPSAEDPYFLCVGTIEPRKNHLMLLDVWSRIVDRLGVSAPQLVIVGQWGVNSKPVRAALAASAALRERVIVLDRCDDRELGGWIVGARAMLLPSLAEGFGLPLVEALKLGVPVVASDLPCFRELGQGIPTLIDPRDGNAWEQAILAYRGESPDRDRQLAATRAFRDWTWDAHFRKVDRWLETLPPRARSSAAASRERIEGQSRPFISGEAGLAGILRE